MPANDSMAERCERCRGQLRIDQASLDRRLLHLEDWAWGPGRDNGVTARIRQVETDLKSLQRTMWAATGAAVLFNCAVLPVLIALAVKWLG